MLRVCRTVVVRSRKRFLPFLRDRRTAIVEEAKFSRPIYQSARTKAFSVRSYFDFTANRASSNDNRLINLLGFTESAERDVEGDVCCRPIASARKINFGFFLFAHTPSLSLTTNIF